MKKSSKSKIPAPKKMAASNLMDDFFAATVKEAGDGVPSAEALRTELEGFIDAHNCGGLIAPQLLTDYILARQGYLASEYMNRKMGRITRDMKLSPYVQSCQFYHKAMSDAYNLIAQAINRYGGSSRQDADKNQFLSLLTNRGF
jgi:hypothetical protein